MALIVSTPDGINGEHLATEILEALQHRLSSDCKYSEDEVRDVSCAVKTLFPSDFVLSAQASERFRALARHSMREVMPLGSITSHRPVTGRFIVAFKKALWPLLRVLLKDAFSVIREHNAILLTLLAAEHVKLERLNRRFLERGDKR